MKFLKYLFLLALVPPPALGDVTQFGTGAPTIIDNGHVVNTGDSNVTEGDVNVAAGDVNIAAGSLTLPTSGGTAANLNHYEEYTHNTTFTWDGGGSTTSAVNCTIIRVGKMVTMRIPPVNANTGTSSGQFTMNTAVPARFRPSQSIAQHVILQENGTDIVNNGFIEIVTDGLFRARRYQGASFTNSANAGINNSLGHTMLIWHLD